MQSRNSTLLGRCGRHLLEVLRGEVDPLSLLFPSDGSISAGNLYRDSIGGRAMNSLMAESVSQIANQLPERAGTPGSGNRSWHRFDNRINLETGFGRSHGVCVH